MAGKLMHAVQYSGYGGGAQALKHVKVPVPEPKVDEVLIKVEAATLNPVDWKIQKGVLRPFLPRNFPTIPGTDIAGEVVQVGSHVNKFKVGDKVVAAVMVANSGALTEYAIAKESLTVARPPEVSAPSGAGLFSSSLTAYQALTKSANIKLDGTDEKKNILVTAASGGVGHYVVQLAKLGNTHITATCGARNLDFVKSLGADEVLDYKTPEGAALTSPSGKKYDFVIHCTSGIKWESFEPNLSETGKVIDLTPSLSGMLTFAINKLTFSKKQLVPMILSPNAEDIEYIMDLVKEGKVKTMIDSKHSLSKAEEAWDRIISGHATGKIIIVP
ncbi:quinone-oxidoreductase homolog, chloroplastic-like [Amaranthus tricolor]|uniref:quinone-oxidoreductase homolog, chloroplastic-like n=1 Tax=Amaranthus tricolor TaxID=29722 RepID=UPI00258A9D4B|nr:quinone-oxidoreductase homolog, chloroplastic-like [Amaranthus tricolor]